MRVPKLAGWERHARIAPHVGLGIGAQGRKRAEDPGARAPAVILFSKVPPGKDRVSCRTR